MWHPHITLRNRRILFTVTSKKAQKANLDFDVDLLLLFLRISPRQVGAIPVLHAHTKGVQRAATLGCLRRKEAGYVQRYRVRNGLVLEPRVPGKGGSGDKYSRSRLSQARLS